MPVAQPLNDYDVNRVFLKNVDYLMGTARALAAKPSIDHHDVEILAEAFDGKPAVKDHPVLREIAKLLEPSHAKTLQSQQGLDSFHEKLRALCGIGGDGKPRGSTEILFDEEEEIIFQGRLFCFTGTFEFGSRLKCTQAVEDLGGEVNDDVTIDTDYLVVGSKVTSTWRHDTFGRKITKAKQWQDQGNSPIEIVSEQQWQKALACHCHPNPNQPSPSASNKKSAKKRSHTSHKSSTVSEPAPEPRTAASPRQKMQGTADRAAMVWEFNIDIRPTRLLLYFVVIILLTTVFAVGWNMA